MSTLVRVAHLRQPVPSPEAVRRVTAAATATATVATASGPAATGDNNSYTTVAQLPTRHIVAAVDPDLSGALAMIYWDEEERPPPPPPGAAAPAPARPSSKLPAKHPGSGAAVAEYGTSVAAAAAPPPQQPAWHFGNAGWLMVMPTAADGSGDVGGASSAAASQRGVLAGRTAADGAATAPSDAQDEGDEHGGGSDSEGGDGHCCDGGSSGGGVSAAAAAGDGLWLPAPPPPPDDLSLWTVRVWDMPVSAAERRKPTATGGVSKRRLLHVAGARAVLASALASALPPPEERRRVALYGYVEVPPILPGDGIISAYTSLWSTGAWLGLLTGMGFAVAVFTDAFRHKKNHGRADALLMAAWALGASLPPRLAGTLRRNHMTVDELLAEQPAAALMWGPPRPPTPTDAYGNLLTPERDMMDEVWYGIGG
ncbi:hypothetical protein VOLCADRAFT_98614 [Volvox carteri f. nagariensis]|uniref:Uncharacterized protein n=1 Tax=Volvox carteri f. nagariensis TaxID=3068 RepID=D8UFT8_VOLCA|nr:uncharacterized protein VOLCADRAFT_98614 [Volvox carteri f. nagariensis]EFJ41438.1 hypothetical protein VOLCADRAFT_98614 [Volvox carteri f. nagariensis]|eukprot:XP_002957544.1 hypothetical protein VOLCADRAFT_98614 [Volvox carteri f. nagariensis]